MILSAGDCNPTCRRLQPHVLEAATPCAEDTTPRARGCNPTCWRLQPHVPEAASLHDDTIRVQLCFLGGGGGDLAGVYATVG